VSETPKKKATPRKTAAKKKEVLPAESSYVPPSHKEVELLAYQLWVDRGRPHGNDAQDWLRAEEQLSRSNRR
jgi:Protein of unknown function (DUF2934)